LAADIIVTATGLRLKLLGGATLSLDGRPLEVAKSVVYRGVMYSGVPNLAVATGYTNASWTLKCELAARYVCRVLNHMRATDRDVCMPVHEHPEAATRPFIELSSGYVRRSADHLPRQDARKPWRLYQNYPLDLLSLRYSRMEDGALKFTRGPR